MNFFSVALLSIVVSASFLDPVKNWAAQKVQGPKTVADRVEQYKADALRRLKPSFEKADVTFPPKKVTLVFLKDTRKLYLFAGDSGSQKLVKSYPVHAASGKAGPKLKQGDRQVPEGIYKIEALNPNSSYHLSLRVNYPSPFDREKAKQDSRKDLGGDIMIHGSDVSIGCVAIGDTGIEDLFVLATMADYQKWKLIFAPFDLRKAHRGPKPSLPTWIPELDEKLLSAFKELPPPHLN